MIAKIAVIVLAAGSFLSGCKSHAPEKTSEHEHEEIKLKLTAYSDKLEVFAESDPFSTEETSEILAHFTNLNDFKPLAGGAVTASLTSGGQTTTQTVDQPFKPGIYKFSLKAAQAGTGKLSFSLQTDSGKIEIEVPDIHVFADEHEAIHAAEDALHAQSGGVAFSKEQSWKIDFATETPHFESFGQVIKTTAIVRSAPSDEVTISARTAGIVKFTGDGLLVGKSISSGQTLLNISGDEMADNNSSTRFAEARNNYEKAKSDFDRMIALAKEKIVSDKDLLESKNKFENAQAIYNNLNTHFSEKGQNVKATMNGFVKQVFVENGQFVEAGQPLVSVAKNQSLLLQAEVQQKYAAAVSHVSSAIIRIPSENKSYTLAELHGKIAAIGKSTGSNFQIPVSLQISNNGDFFAGSFVDLFLKASGDQQVLTVPNTALLEEQGIYFVFVQQHPELFEKREIKTGATDGLRTEIKSGISASDRVVTKGAVMVKLAQSSGALDAHAGHVH